MKTKTRSSAQKDREWEEVWNARETALKKILGKPGRSVFHAMIPLAFGGTADVVPFPKYVPGMSYVTAEMTGQAVGQKKNKLGNYELLICSRKASPDCAGLIATIARFTCEAKLQPGDTMDIDGAFGRKSAIKNLLFWHPGNKPCQFKLFEARCGLLLCLGITAKEFSFARENGPQALVDLLIQSKVFPYTTVDRKSVM